MKCPKCQAENPDTSRFCGNCATALIPTQTARPSTTQTRELSLPAVPSGTVLAGRYEILEMIGAGGMGEVYRAVDRNLGRHVAIKILPPAFAEDRERMARFDREAKLLALLNHPNLATIHGLEESGGRRYLVLEFVEGETLLARLSRGPLSLEDALTTCRELAEGMEAAHERGIVHRDLKPGNIMITPEGKVKILDFGLAKAYEAETSGIDIANSPTITAQMTEPGVVLGTASYMSPEQARGRSVDKRADIWAFGCILYECLSGKRAFQGDTVTDTLAQILKGDPDWDALPASVSPEVVAVLRRCLRKNLKERLHDIADVRIELDECSHPVAAAGLPVKAHRLWALPWLLSLLSIAILVTFILTGRWRRPVFPTPVKRFTIPLGPVSTLSSASLSISPDGTELAYAIDGQLFRRPLDRLAAARVGDVPQPVDSCFFVSSDWIGFQAEGQLMKVLLATGASTTLADSPSFYGASGWSGQSLVFVPGAAMGLWQIPLQGGQRSLVLVPDFGKGERSFRWPDALPGDRVILFTRLTTQCSSFDDAEIVAYSLKDGTMKRIASGGTFPRYAGTGHVLFARSGNLQALPFDTGTLAPTGPARTVLEGIMMDRLSGRACFDISGDGTLAYIPGEVVSRKANVIGVGRNGNRETLLKSELVEREIRVSPDGTRLAFTKNSDIWVYDMSLKTQIRITFDAGIDADPVWSPDGHRICFASNRDGTMDIYEKSADGTGPEAKLYGHSDPVRPMSWSPDGKILAFVEESQTSNDDIWLVSFSEEGQPSPRKFASSAFHERQPVFSPDGRWIAYISDESGEFDVYLQSVGGTGQRRKISIQGGIEPLWHPNGREIIYFHDKSAFSVAMDAATGVVSSMPRALFEAPGLITSSRYRNVDISRDGSRFFGIVAQDEPKELQINIVLNWFDELARLAPTGKK